jgi:hypothetical protein
MLTTLHGVAAVGLIWLDLDLEVLESNNFTEKRSVGKLGSLRFGFRILLASADEKRIRSKMFHVNRSLSPNSP